MFHFTLKQNHFLFDNKVYDQVDGVAMGSPLGPIMANIFMNHLETSALQTYTGALPLLYKRYVDDTFLVFNHRNEMLDLFTWFNQQHPSIAFTKEEEVNNQLSFLDVLVSRSSQGNVTTSVYRKPSFSGLYMRWDSFSPKSYKKSLVNCLVFRAWRLCSSYEGFHLELDFLRSMLSANGYPASFVENVICTFLNKQYDRTCTMPTFGPERKEVYLCLPFIGENAAIKLARQLKRLLARVAPWITLRIIFKPARKLSCLSRMKDRFPILADSGVVYQVSCTECAAFYIGKTKRRLQQRLLEHQQQEYSALYKHSVDYSHVIDFQHPVILASDSNDYKLQIKEAINIKDRNANSSLNANLRSCELMLW